MIKRIELVNFMSHERTVIEPSAGLTVLIGPNNCGKSAFVTALQILCHNSKSSYVMRHGEKKCQIVVETNDGHTIEWSKTKSGSPVYLIDGEKKDRLRGGVPDQLHEILGLDKVNCDKDQFDVHFGEQKSPVFLLNDSGRASAQFFASSSDAIRLVEMQDRHKGKVRDAKRDAKRLKTEKDEIDEALESLAPITDIDTRLKKCESNYRELEDAEQKIAQTEILIHAIEELELKLVQQHATLKALDDLSEPPAMQDWKRLDQLQTGIQSAAAIHDRSSQSAKALVNISPVPKLDDENQLANLTLEISSASLTYRRSAETAKSLAQVLPAPKISDESELFELTRKLAWANQQTDAFDRRLETLSRVGDLPELQSYESLDRLLTSLNKSNNDVKACEKQLKEIKRASSETKSTIEDWVVENPSCPTCGGKTDVDQILSGTGGHQHG